MRKSLDQVGAGYLGCRGGPHRFLGEKCADSTLPLVRACPQRVCLDDPRIATAIIGRVTGRFVVIVSQARSPLGMFSVARRAARAHGEMVGVKRAADRNDQPVNAQEEEGGNVL